MSLVGPRPLLVEYLDLYSPRAGPPARGPARASPGWAQVNGRNATTWDERFAHDVLLRGPPVDAPRPPHPRSARSCRSSPVPACRSPARRRWPASPAPARRTVSREPRRGGGRLRPGPPDDRRARGRGRARGRRGARPGVDDRRDGVGPSGGRPRRSRRAGCRRVRGRGRRQRGAGRRHRARARRASGSRARERGAPGRGRRARRGRRSGCHPHGRCGGRQRVRGRRGAAHGHQLVDRPRQHGGRLREPGPGRHHRRQRGASARTRPSAWARR